MAGRKSKLTPETQDKIVSYTRSGAFAWVAAQAAGVGKSTFHRWMQLGENAKRGRYRAFFEAVQEAHAQARAAAEMEVRRLDPFKWLRVGPGRERPGEPGWTERREIVGADGGPLLISFDIEQAPEVSSDDD